MKVRINQLLELNVEQIKISGSLTVGGKEISAGLNKTLSADIISQLPPELIETLTSQVFGADFSSEEIASLIETLQNEEEENL